MAAARGLTNSSSPACSRATAGTRLGDLARREPRPARPALVQQLYPDTGSAFAVGITGPPGVGKSSLIGALDLGTCAGST